MFIYIYIYIEEEGELLPCFYEDFTEVDNKPLRRGSWILNSGMQEDFFDCSCEMSSDIADFFCLVTIVGFTGNFDDFDQCLDIHSMQKIIVGYSHSLHTYYA